MTVQDFVFSPFDSIQFSCIGTLRIVTGNTYKCTVQADDGLLEKLRIVESNGTLYLEFRQPFSFFSWIGRNTSRSTIITVEVPTIRKITVSGIGTIEAPDLKSEHLNLDINGAAKVQMNANVKDLLVDIAGAASVDIAGSAAKQHVSINGAGSYYAEKMTSENADISIHGAGKSRIHASDTLKVTIGGAGSLLYYGDPRIEPSIYGAGSIRRAEEDPFHEPNPPKDSNNPKPNTEEANPE